MDVEFTPNADELLDRNEEASRSFDLADLPTLPTRRLVVVTCMDARLDPLRMLGLDVGEANIIRNAGGVVTDDVVRSICLSQRLLGTCEVLLVHHTDCGLHKLDESGLRRELEHELGVKPAWSMESFDDPYDDVAQSIQRLHMTPFLRQKVNVRGFVYEVTDGLLHEVGLHDRLRGMS